MADDRADDRAKAAMKNDRNHQRGGPARREASVDILGPNSEIGRRLRQYYDGLVSEEVPDRFVELLGRLEAAETGGADDRKDGKEA